METNVLLNAIRDGCDVDFVIDQLQAGADINATDSCGNTALIQAVRYNNSPLVVQALLTADANVNKVNSNGNTALMQAASISNPLVVKVLLAAGAEVNRVNSYGYTALMLAVRFNSSPLVVKALLAASADVNKVRSYGMTALLQAAQSSNNPEVVKALLDAGAEVNKVNSHGYTALMLALNATANVYKYGNTASKDSGERIIALLLAYGGLLSTRDFDKPSFSRLKLMRNLIAYNLEVNNCCYINIYRKRNTYEINKSCSFSLFMSVSKASSESHIFSSGGSAEAIALLICSFLRPPPCSYFVLYKNLKDKDLAKVFINSRSAQRAFPGIEHIRFDESQVALLMGSGSDRKELSMELDPGRKDLSIG